MIHGNFSFDLGLEPNSFVNVTYHNPLGGKPQVLDLTFISDMIGASGGVVSVADLRALDFPCREAARAIQSWLDIQKAKFDKECEVAKLRGESPPNWKLWK